MLHRLLLSLAADQSAAAALGPARRLSPPALAWLRATHRALSRGFFPRSSYAPSSASTDGGRAGGPGGCGRPRHVARMSLSKLGEAAADLSAVRASLNLMQGAWRISHQLALVTGHLATSKQYPAALMYELKDISNDLKSVHEALGPLRELDNAIKLWLLRIPQDFDLLDRN
eukprot:344374-Rhodomonas_salina.1